MEEIVKPKNIHKINNIISVIEEILGNSTKIEPKENPIIL